MFAQTWALYDWPFLSCEPSVPPAVIAVISSTARIILATVGITNRIANLFINFRRLLISVEVTFWQGGLLDLRLNFVS